MGQVSPVVLIGQCLMFMCAIKILRYRLFIISATGGLDFSNLTGYMLIVRVSSVLKIALFFFKIFYQGRVGVLMARWVLLVIFHIDCVWQYLMEVFGSKL